MTSQIPGKQSRDRSILPVKLGELPWKDATDAATTGVVTLSGAQTIDGVALTAGQRVLVKDQADQAENGIYLVATGVWSRATDASTTAELASAIVGVREGTANGMTFWEQRTADPVIGTSNIVWALFGGNPRAAGDGLELTGNSLAVKSGDATIEVDAGGVRAIVREAGDGLELSVNDLEVKPGDATIEVDAGGVRAIVREAGDGLELVVNDLLVKAGDASIEVDAGGVRAIVREAGDGLELNGNELSVVAANTSVEVDVDGISAAVPYQGNKAMSPTATAALTDYESTGLTIDQAPAGNGDVSVSVNGQLMVVADIDRDAGDCYFSDDSGATAKAISDIETDDELFWNGGVGKAEFKLAVADSVSFYYNVVQPEGSSSSSA